MYMLNYKNTHRRKMTLRERVAALISSLVNGTE